MTLRGAPGPEEFSFPDNTIPVVGDQGDVVFQSNGKFLTTRTRADEANWSFLRQDVTEDEVVANPSDIGGTQYLNGAIKSADSKSFSVKIRWEDELNNALYTQEPAALQKIDGTDDYEAVLDSISVKSARASVRVIDESGDVTHEITGSINFA